MPLSPSPSFATYPSLQDASVIVTGGAGGIGAAACQAIAAEGGKVVVADLDAAAAQAVAG